MFDENAFGMLLDYFNIEDEEYAEEEPTRFVERFSAFQRLGVDRLLSSPPAAKVQLFALGHALYLEFAQDETSQSGVGWLKATRTAFTDAGFATVGVLTHGGRWRAENTVENRVEQRDEGAVALAHVSFPSEPLRRALLASAASHGAAGEGWGPGLYVDTEALSALGLAPKNAPTLLTVAGAEFYRVGR